MSADKNEIGLSSLKEDLVSGFLVFLIALPLSLGIAMASGFPPIAGVVTAIVGGILGTLLGSARLTIKGPAAGLIVIALGAVTELQDPGDPLSGYKRALAVGVVAGVLQVVLALLRSGALGDAFPPSVVHGMLAAIGVIIFSKQAHTVMGVQPEAQSPLGALAEIPQSFARMNPEIFLIGALSLLVLFGLPQIKWLKKVPAPMVVVVLAVALERAFDLHHEHSYSFQGQDYEVGPTYLVQLPGQLLQAVAFPDFSRILSGVSLKYIVMFTLVGSIESLLSAKAVDQLDPQRRQSDLNRDLLVTGVANVVSSAIGGLPMISEIVRSSHNINSGAKTRMSNFFHGCFLLVFVALLPGLLQRIPLAALGAMLVYTGIRLASPNEFAKAFRIGVDQLAVFLITMLVTLATDLLMGVAAGVVAELVVHFSRGASLEQLFSARVTEHDEGELRVVRVVQPALFTNYIGLKRRIAALAQEREKLALDLSGAQVVDHTVLENLHHWSSEWQRSGKSLIVRGLEAHHQASPHTLASRWKRSPGSIGMQALAPKSESDVESLGAAIERGLAQAAHLLPDQGPIDAFVHHNTLHAFQHLPFHAAMQRAWEVYGAEPYLSEEKFRALLAQGRITRDDLTRVLRERWPERNRSFGGVLEESQVLFAMLRYPIEAETSESLRWLIQEREVTRRLREDVGEAERTGFLVGSARALRELLEPEHDDGPLRFAQIVTGRESRTEAEWSLRRHFALQLERAELLKAVSERGEALCVNALWNLCRARTRGYAPRPTAAHRQASALHRDLLLAKDGEDAYDRLFPLLIRLTSAYLDEGIASWRMPARELGFYAAVRKLAVDGPVPPVRWQREARQDFRDQLERGLSAMDAVQEALLELGVNAADAEKFIPALLLTLPGWAGLMSRLERHPHDRERHAPPASLLDFLAVRLTYERAVLRDLARASGVDLRSLFDAHHGASDRAPHGEGAGAYRLFQLLQLTGIPVSMAAKLTERDALDILDLMDEFDELTRRRVFQEAYELHYRNEVLDAIAAHRAQVRLGEARERPSMQFVCCFDDREEGFRRHLEEVEARAETFGAPGFFGFAMHFRPLDQPRSVPLGPAARRPEHRVDEEPHPRDLAVSESRLFRRKIWGQTQLHTHLGSRSLWRGAALNLALGMGALGPLLVRVGAPRLAGRLQRWAAFAVFPAPRTELTVRRRDDGRETEARGFTLEESVARVATALEDIGLTRNFARVLVLLGHGADTLNNPHRSAYNCGACGGGQGGPNARVFARMANDPEVRAGLTQRGISVPEDTLFVGGQHDTCSERVVLFDLDLAPASHAEALAAVRAAVDEARARSAQERCRRLFSAPHDASPRQALFHVEGRSEHLAEPRPEFGHATNAVAIIGRRALTRGLFLDRRAFVLSYDPTIDAQGSILARILGPALSVGAGINLEYYFSHVDNERYGAGSKLPHNVACLLGVMSGHASDLRTGLPRQMIEIHEPMRLLILVEATPERLLDIARRQPEVSELVVNAWVQLVSVDPESGAMHLFKGHSFEPYTPRPAALPEAASSRDFYRGRSGLLPPARISAGARVA